MGALELDNRLEKPNRLRSTTDRPRAIGQQLSPSRNNCSTTAQQLLNNDSATIDLSDD